jgi:hypothetical protein
LARPARVKAHQRPGQVVHRGLELAGLGVQRAEVGQRQRREGAVAAAQGQRRAVEGDGGAAVAAAVRDRAWPTRARASSARQARGPGERGVGLVGGGGGGQLALDEQHLGQGAAQRRAAAGAADSAARPRSQWARACAQRP